MLGFKVCKLTHLPRDIPGSQLRESFGLLLSQLLLFAGALSGEALFQLACKQVIKL